MGAPQRTIFIIQAHPSKGVQKNMLKAWYFSKNKLCHRCIDNNLQKNFRPNILENGTGQILLIVVLMVNLWLKLQMVIVDKMISSLHNFVWTLRAVIYRSTETPSLAVFNVFKLTLLTIFVKTTVMDNWWYFWPALTAQKMKFFIKDFFSKCNQIRKFLSIWSHLLKKSLKGKISFFEQCLTQAIT